MAKTAFQSTGARIEVRDLTKSYGSVVGLNSVSLDVRPGEFLALLGPSGSGKSTLLMSVAGFERPTAGRILIDGDDVVRVPPHRRNLGMMFQNYALFPHLSVLKNVEYPLKARGVPPSERTKQAREALRLVSLEGFDNRRVSQLSGGQQQRVALARAIVFTPSLLLMDEPLGALDQKLREKVQLEIRSLHRQLGATIIFVTHDQREAMTMADRIAVMNDGQIAQVGTPDELYNDPRSKFVAGFLGEMNFLTTVVSAVSSDSISVRIAEVEFRIPASRAAGPVAVGKTASLAVRPHHLTISSVKGRGIPLTVTEVVFRGSSCLLVGTHLGDDVVCDLPVERVGELRPGDIAWLEWRPALSILFPEDVEPNPEASTHQEINREAVA